MQQTTNKTRILAIFFTETLRGHYVDVTLIIPSIQGLQMGHFQSKLYAEMLEQELLAARD